jgi:hypothetical protein
MDGRALSGAEALRAAGRPGVAAAGPPAAPEAAVTVARRGAWLPALIAAITGCAGGIAWSEVRLREALVMRPPLVAVDYRPILAQLASGRDAAALAPAFAAYKARASAFRQAGYLVFNRATLEAIPEALLIPPPMEDMPPVPRAGEAPVALPGAPAPAAGTAAAPLPSAPDASPRPVTPPAAGPAEPAGGNAAPQAAGSEMSAAEAAALLRAMLRRGSQP